MVHFDVHPLSHRETRVHRVLHNMHCAHTYLASAAHGLYGYGLYSYGLCSYGLYGYGP